MLTIDFHVFSRVVIGDLELWGFWLISAFFSLGRYEAAERLLTNTVGLVAERLQPLASSRAA